MPGIEDRADDRAPSARARRRSVLNPSVTGQPAVVAFPDLPTGREFKEHTMGFLLPHRDSRLRVIDQLLDDYKVSLEEYRKLCAVHDHGVVALRQVNNDYLEALQLRVFQRRYCLERARWEPGLRLEQQALARLQNATSIDPGHVEFLRETLAVACHRDETPSELDTSFEKPQLRRREELVLQILTLTEEAEAGKRAIEDLERAQLLLSENATSGQWLAGAREAGQPPPDLAQMQAQLAKTEERIEQLQYSRDERVRHMGLDVEHLKTVCSTTAARLLEVSRRLDELKGHVFEALIKRDTAGFLARLRQSTCNVGTLLARHGLGHIAALRR